jgi:hypothetical protein
MSTPRGSGGPVLTLYQNSRTRIPGIGYSELAIHGQPAVPHFTANCGQRTQKFNIRTLGRREAFRRALRARAAYERKGAIA